MRRMARQGWDKTSALIILMLAWAGMALAAVGREWVLVEDGKPRSVIVAAEGLSPSEKTAVADLQNYLRQMSGARIEVVKPDQAGKADGLVKLVVGNKTVRALYPEVKLDDLGKEGYILKTTGDAVLVAGGELRGTMYGAFELLEQLGVRWWTSAETDVPERATVQVPSQDLRYKPTLEYRDAFYVRGNYINNETNGIRFATRTRMNGFGYGNVTDAWGGRVWYAQNLVHTHRALMQPVGDLDGRFQTHPEYWALRNGKRVDAQVCPLQPEVFEVMKANVIKQLKDNPKYEFVVVGQEDNFNYCLCEQCKALAEAEGTAGAPYLVLANKIGEVVEKEFPDKFVLTSAYNWSRMPPKTLKPRSNVGIVLCSIECDFSRPLEEASTLSNKEFAENIQKWSAIAHKLYIWDYTCNFTHYLAPFPNLDALVPNIKFYVKNKVRGILCQGAHNGYGAEFAFLRNWVLNRAMWKPEQLDDGQALITEFVNGYYGKTGPYIQKYIDAIHAPGRANPAMNAGCYARLDAQWLTPEAIANGEAAMREAEKAVADNPVLLSRVQLAHVPMWYMLFKRGPQSKTWAATEAKVGKLDIVKMAEDFRNTGKTWGLSKLAENGGQMEGFYQWVKDYASQAAVAVPLPPELKDANPSTYRLIQAAQMDTRAKELEAVEGASDGWACKIGSVAWTVFYQANLHDDIVPGKKYKVFMRVKSTKPGEQGVAFTAGMNRGGWQGADHGPGEVLIRPAKPAASVLADGQFHGVQIGEFTARDRWYNGSIWIAKANDKSPAIYLDCLWLQEIAPSP